MRALSIGTVNLRRMLRDRSNIFFVFVLPLAIILFVGIQFGGGGPGLTIGVASDGGALASAVEAELEESGGMAVERYTSGGAMLEAVERGRVAAGVDIPANFDAAIAAGDEPVIGFVVRPDTVEAVQPVVGAAVARVTASDRVARVLVSELGLDEEQALAAATSSEPTGITVREAVVGESLFPPGTRQFSIGASQQLVLFVFLTALTGSAAMIQSRQLGVTRRMLSTPTAPTTVVVGEGLGRFSVGIVQGLYIVGMTWAVFGVRWGDPLGAAALLVALSATGAGAAMLLGTLFRNDQQAGGFAVLIGLGMGALGGCMLPLELFSPTMTRIAHLTPHAWAVGGFGELVHRGGTIADIGQELGVLTAYASLLLALAGWRLRRVITSGG